MNEPGTAIAEITSWTLVSESPIPSDVEEILAPGEDAVAAYKTVRDTAIFTTKRLIVRDVHGLRGRKAEVYSLPYSSINMWSSENAHGMDMSAEVELWTWVGQFKIKLRRGIDIRRFDKLIASALFN